VHSPYRGRDASVGKTAQESRRRGSPGGGAEGFDEKNLQEARQDDVTGGPRFVGFLAYELNEGGQPALAADVHELREKRNQQGRVR
jgi:hypothetical protein